MSEAMRAYPRREVSDLVPAPTVDGARAGARVISTGG
jgi:hypothetical protein